ncbi:MAG: AbrB/MazE/SpoVT family DNA-binding domain-containing protein [Bryobacterales bacterium]|nr:AbrB/MazE/SpoVT family DNA-binding domain-containing protein [Bryobacterales bacterium]
MPIAESKITAQGQISVPAAVRKRMGVGPGSVLEWVEVDGQLVVRKAGKRSFADIHQALFPAGAPARKSVTDWKRGIEGAVRARHAKH